MSCASEKERSDAVALAREGISACQRAAYGLPPAVKPNKRQEQKNFAPGPNPLVGGAGPPGTVFDYAELGRTLGITLRWEPPRGQIWVIPW